MNKPENEYGVEYGPRPECVARAFDLIDAYHSAMFALANMCAVCVKLTELEAGLPWAETIAWHAYYSDIHTVVEKAAMNAVIPVLPKKEKKAKLPPRKFGW